MEQHQNQSKTQLRHTPYFVPLICLGLICVVLLIANADLINGFLRRFFSIFRSVLIGLLIAYFANPFFKFFERKMLCRIRQFRLRRALSLLLTYLVLLLIAVILVLLIVPQLYSSVANFLANFEFYLSTAVGKVNGILMKINTRLPQKSDGSPALALWSVEKIEAFYAGIWDTLLTFLKKNFNSENIGHVLGILKNATTVISDLVFGFFASLYLLASKEKRYAQIMKFRSAFFSDSTNRKITQALAIARDSFGGFLQGKIFDSAIVGVLTFVLCMIFQIPYGVLVATVVGITDIVPVIGPFIGVIPTAVIILLTDPIKVIPFVLGILVIQQIDGNVIAPKILGDHVGVSSLCVLIAILVMGNIWGLVGMLVGVPLFATGIEYVKMFISKRTAEKSGEDGEGETAPILTEAEIPRSKKKLTLRKKMIRLKQQETDGSGDITPFEKLQLAAYSLAFKRLLSENLTDEALENIVNEESVSALFGKQNTAQNEGGEKQ